MCGIFGFIKSGFSVLEDDQANYQGKSWQQWSNSYQNTSEGTLYKSLLFATALRGIDSTGTTVVNHKDSTTITRKLPVNAIQFSTLGEYKLIDSLVDKEDIGVIGHCRAGTIGSASYKASHPFDLEYIVGCHNGTLTNHTSLGVNNPISDSEAIFYMLNGSKEYVKDIERLRGSYALVWYDKTAELYYFCRNDERPLWYYDTGYSLAFASELDILQFGLCRAYNENVEQLRNRGTFKYFEKYTLYEYDPKTGVFETFNIEKPVVIDYPKQYSSKSSHHSNYRKVNETVIGSPFNTEDNVELVPCGYTEYPNGSLGFGSLYGYIYYAGKSFFWISYGIKEVKKYFTKIYSGFPVVPELWGTISHQSYQESRAEINSLTDVLTGVKVQPERNEADEVLVITITANSLAVKETAEDQNTSLVLQ